jgi:hypothetical protein
MANESSSGRSFLTSLGFGFTGFAAAIATALHLTTGSAPGGASHSAVQQTSPGSRAEAPSHNDIDQGTTAWNLLADYVGVDSEAAESTSATQAKLEEKVTAALAAHHTDLEFLIASVPDPVDSLESWQFDSQFDAIRQGIQASGFLLDRFYLPDAPSDPNSSAARPARSLLLHRHRPGVVLFRQGARNGRTTVLVTFLVPETPVSGIHQEPFEQAIKFVLTYDAQVPIGGRVVRLLGPEFSGSTPSLTRALANADAAYPGAWKVNVVTGSASNDGNKEAFLNALPGRVQFRSTMHSNGAIQKGLERFLAEVDVDRAPIAYLSEATTAYGSDVVKDRSSGGRRITVKFPFNISQLRSDASRDDASKRPAEQIVVTDVRPLLLDDQIQQTDQIPSSSPQTATSSVDLTLAHLLDAVRSEGARVVSIDATDVRDKLFLIKQVREHIPDALIVTTDADLFQVHPDQSQWLKGVVVASTYPLHPWSRALVFPFGTEPRANGDVIQFPNVNAEGVYNATLLLLRYPLDPAPRQASAPDRPQLLDYGGYGNEECIDHPDNQPAVWISVVGDGELVPLRSYCELDSADVNYVYKRVGVRGDGPPPEAHATSYSGLSMLFVSAVAALFVAIALTALFSSQKGPAVRTMAALAALGPTVPLTLLAIVFAGWAHEGRAAQTGTWYWIAAASAACGTAVALCFVAQWRAPGRVVWLAGSIAAVSVTVGYALPALNAAPLLFIQRVLDSSTITSPLLLMTTCGCVPLIAAAGEWRRRRTCDSAPTTVGRIEQSIAPVGAVAVIRDRVYVAFGLGGPYVAALTHDAGAGTTPRVERWIDCVTALENWAVGGVDDLTPVLADDEASTASPIVIAVAIAVVVAIVALASSPSVLLSFEGRAFAGIATTTIVSLQLLLTIALFRFARLSRATLRLLSRLHLNPTRPALANIPRALQTGDLVPRVPVLSDLEAIADAADGRDVLRVDLKDGARCRWYESRTWAAFAAQVRAIDPNSDTTTRGHHIALTIALVVRELVGRLGVNLVVIGPSIAALVAVYLVASFDRSHTLLGLLWIDATLAIAVVMSTFVALLRDPIVSEINGTTPGAINFDSELLWKIVVYVLLPLGTLFATQFPHVGSAILRLLQPVQRLP